MAHELARGRMGRSAEWRLVPVANLGLGTCYTGAGLGTYGELGWNLVDALGGFVPSLAAIFHGDTFATQRENA